MPGHFNKRGWKAKPNSPKRPSLIEAQDAQDEEQAYFALRRIKQRAKLEREELSAARRRAAITLPKLKFLGD